MKIKLILLAILIVFAAFIRTYHLDTLPPSLYYDEVDAGYQAMVFNQNHTDYYGNKFPVHFHSFGDYRTSLQIYSIALFQHLTPDKDLAVRLPSAVFGVMSILVIYLITGSLIPGFLLAISPWVIHYNRTGFEVSGMILCILLGIYFWQKFLQNKKNTFLYPTILFFCLSSYFYSTAKLFIVLIAILIAIIWRKTIQKIDIKKLLLPLLFSLIVMSPMIKDTLNDKASFRFSYISIFTMPHLEQITDNLRYQDILLNHPGQIGIQTPLISKILHNKYQLMIQKFVSNYYQSFSTDFLFLSGDNNVRQGFGGHGLLYLIDAPLLLIGLFFFFKKPDKIGWFFFGFLLLAPIPFALTRDSISAHATRLILLVPPFIYFIYRGIGKKYYLLPIYFLFFLNFWHYYNVHYPQDTALEWNMGMEQAVVDTNQYPENVLVFSDSYLSFVSYFLYYHPYRLDFQSSLADHLTQTSNSTFSGQVLDGKYFFGRVNWTNLSNFPHNAIYVIPTSEYKPDSFWSFQVLKQVDKKYINQVGFVLLQLK